MRRHKLTKVLLSFIHIQGQFGEDLNQSLAHLKVHRCVHQVAQVKGGLPHPAPLVQVPACLVRFKLIELVLLEVGQQLFFALLYIGGFLVTGEKDPLIE